jgi:hypothetical protein
VEIEVMCDEDGREYEVFPKIFEVQKEEFIQVMLRLHQFQPKMEIYGLKF